MSKEQICAEADYIPDLHYDSFYIIPKSLNPSFYDYTIDSSLALVFAKFDGEERIYVAAPDSLDYYEVTTPGDMEKYGIEIVDQIGQE